MVNSWRIWFAAWFKQLRWLSGKSVRLWSSKHGFDSESGQTNDFEIGIYSFPAWRSALKGQSGEQVGKFTCCAVGKGTGRPTKRNSPILVR